MADSKADNSRADPQVDARPSAGPRAARLRTSTVAFRAALYYAACWSTLALVFPTSVPGGRWWVALLALATTVPLVRFIVRGGWQRYPTAAFRLFVVRPILYTQLLLPLTAAGAVIGLVIGTLFGAPLLGGRIAATIVLGVLATLAFAGYLGTHRLVTRQIDATVPGLPPEFDGLRIAQISDLHVGPQTSRRFLARVVRTTMALTPDLIAITGDLIDDRQEDVPHFAAGLGRLHAPLGVFIIPGNHDVYAGWQAVERNLRASFPATVLVNEARVFTRGDAQVALVGTGDPAGRRTGDAAPDIATALADIPPDAVVIALAHNPALWPALADRGVALTLSGHTHWGQFAFPRLGWSMASPFLAHAMGAHEEDGKLLYIHPGTGYWGIPFRIGASPEVALITLRAGATADVRMSDAEAVGQCRDVTHDHVPNLVG
jgi:predicted MPP superfamily phosphohydrolase